MTDVTGRSEADRLPSWVRPCRLLPGVDGRSTWARKAAAQIRAYLAELGGIENCRTAECSIIRRIATLEIELERLEAKFANAGAAAVADLETYQRCANSQRRLLEAIGLERRAREVEPSFGVVEQEADE